MKTLQARSIAWILVHKWLYWKLSRIISKVHHYDASEIGYHITNGGHLSFNKVLCVCEIAFIREGVAQSKSNVTKINYGLVKRFFVDLETIFQSWRRFLKNVRILIRVNSQSSGFKNSDTIKYNWHSTLYWGVDIMKVDSWLFKNFKMPFLRDIENSFQELTQMGLERHHFCSF